MRKERPERREFVVEARARETDRDHERGLSVSQALVEIGRFLFRDMVDPVGRKTGAGRRVEGVQIADYRRGHMTEGQRLSCSAVGSHKCRSNC